MSAAVATGGDDPRQLQAQKRWSLFYAGQFIRQFLWGGPSLLAGLTQVVGRFGPSFLAAFRRRTAGVVCVWFFCTSHGNLYNSFRVPQCLYKVLGKNCTGRLLQLLNFFHGEHQFHHHCSYQPNYPAGCWTMGSRLLPNCGASRPYGSANSWRFVGEDGENEALRWSISDYAAVCWQRGGGFLVVTGAVCRS